LWLQAIGLFFRALGSQGISPMASLLWLNELEDDPNVSKLKDIILALQLSIFPNKAI